MRTDSPHPALIPPLIVHAPPFLPRQPGVLLFLFPAQTNCPACFLFLVYPRAELNPAPRSLPNQSPRPRPPDFLRPAFSLPVQPIFSISATPPRSLFSSPAGFLFFLFASALSPPRGTKPRPHSLPSQNPSPRPRPLFYSLSTPTRNRIIRLLYLFSRHLSPLFSLPARN